MKLQRTLSLPVLKGIVLGVKVYRGFARLCDLALISRADIYDQKANPTGTQRDLSPKHAQEAYEYVKNRQLAYWPEVFLCARNKEAFKFEPGTNGQCGTLKLNLNVIRKAKSISISRIDGNHRLQYADGKTPGYRRIERPVAFCLAYDLNINDEIILFRDINDNQKRMNTSHLDNIEARLTPEGKLKRDEPALFIARELGNDKESPFYKRIYEGGVKGDSTEIPLRTLKTGIEYMLSRPSRLKALKETTAQYKVIKNYFNAVKAWLPAAWSEPKKYLVLRGAGLWGICFLGADVADRVLSKGAFGTDEMLALLQGGRKWDWAPKGDFVGLSGRGGAVKISEMISAEFQDETSISVKDLYKKIMEAG